jgi:dihydroxyacetone kinase-like predicted kinase
MNRDMQNINYAEVTYAVRDSAVNGLDIKEGDIIGIINGKISLKGTSTDAVVLVLLEKIEAEDSELITLLYGADINEDQAMVLKEKIAANYPDSEVEMHYGGQPHYSYLLSVE